MLILFRTHQLTIGKVPSLSNYHRFCSSNTTKNLKNNESAKIRVAIIGAGASGMSTALHLAPLAKQGLIKMPIDVYEKSSPSDSHPHDMQAEIGANEDFHPGSGHIGRDIGVGIWSTALAPFLTSGSNTHKQLIKDLEEKGQYVGNVGYRTPNGHWLTKGKLNTSGMNNFGHENNDPDPALLFIREKDFLASLRNACEVEEKDHGTIQIHHRTEVEDIILPNHIDEAYSGYIKFSESTNSISAMPYQIIIAADGMCSTFRKRYAGYSKEWEQKSGITAKLSEEYEKKVLSDLNAIEDRNYTVFRGNAPLSNNEAHMDGVSFQTWGEGKSMRFAAVGMSHPDLSNPMQRKEEQVWFATICDSLTKDVKNAEERKQRLAASFKDWHEPVCSLIESTPANKIFMERGVGHKHSVYPVLNFSHIVEYLDRKKLEYSQYDLCRSLVSPGPILCFTGDASMTVDPVLAQGFTIAMESAADLATTLDSILSNPSSYNASRIPRLEIENALIQRNQRRYKRILCLLRATELVQAISQPSATISGILSNIFIRPAMMLTPSFLKEPIFSYMIKYSLGLYGSQPLYNKGISDITKAANINSTTKLK